MPSSKAKDVKKGMIVNYNGSLHKVAELFHGTPGNLRAFIQVDLRDLKTGNSVKKRFAVDDALEVAYLEQKDMEYLYREGENYVFMDVKTYEQVTLGKDVVGDEMKYLKENVQAKVTYHDSTPLSLELPTSVSLIVKDTGPSAKGDTVSNVFKPATLETGIELKVPLYIEIGDTVKVDTRTGEFLERVRE
jgi:elongation factor P